MTSAARLPPRRSFRGGLVILPGTGHIGPLLQAPDELADLTIAFWRQPAQVAARHRVRSPLPLKA
jgi:hypothetical protein